MKDSSDQALGKGFLESKYAKGIPKKRKQLYASAWGLKLKGVKYLPLHPVHYGEKKEE